MILLAVVGVACVLIGFAVGVAWVTVRLPQVLAHMTPEQRLGLVRKMNDSGG